MFKLIICNSTAIVPGGIKKKKSNEVEKETVNYPLGWAR